MLLPLANSDVAADLPLASAMYSPVRLLEPATEAHHSAMVAARTLGGAATSLSWSVPTARGARTLGVAHPCLPGGRHADHRVGDHRGHRATLREPGHPSRPKLGIARGESPASTTGADTRSRPSPGAQIGGQVSGQPHVQSPNLPNATVLARGGERCGIVSPENRRWWRIVSPWAKLACLAIHRR